LAGKDVGKTPDGFKEGRGVGTGVSVGAAEGEEDLDGPVDGLPLLGAGVVARADGNTEFFLDGILEGLLEG
jgi:hypothetical protein